MVHRPSENVILEWWLWTMISIWILLTFLFGALYKKYLSVFGMPLVLPSYSIAYASAGHIFSTLLLPTQRLLSDLCSPPVS